MFALQQFYIYKFLTFFHIELNLNLSVRLSTYVMMVELMHTDVQKGYNLLNVLSTRRMKRKIIIT